MKRTGFTLIEVMISLTILAIVLAGVMGTSVSMQRSYVGQRERARAQESLRAAQMTLMTVLRAAGADPRSTGRTLLDPDPRATGQFDNLRVVTDFNPADGDVADQLEDIEVWVQNDTLYVRWQAGAAPQALAAPIRSIRFEYWANDGTQLTVREQVVGATRTRFILEAPRDPRLGGLERVESWWVHLRNRS